MKHLLFALLFTSGISQIALAQSPSSFEVIPNPCVAQSTADTSAFFYWAYSLVHNLTSNKFSMKWERHIVSLSQGIETSVCDNTNCWTPEVSSKNFTLNENAYCSLVVDFFHSQFSPPPPGVFSSGIVHLKVTNLDNLADTITAVYTFSTLTRTSDLPAANVRLFPNPTTDFFTLEKAEEVASMRIFALDGRIMARFDVSPDNNYSIGHLPVGNYVLSFEDKNGQLFQAVEIHKR